MNIVRSLAATCGTLAIVSCWAVVEEGGALLWGGFDDITRARAFAEHETLPGLAIATQRQVLNSCYRLFYFSPSVEFLLSRDQERAEIATSCERLAGDAVAKNPLFSFGWMVRAMMAAHLGDTAVMNDSISRSQVAAPFEQWIAIPRVEIAENNLENLSADAARAHEADLRLLASNYTGLGVLATRYIGDVASRERITAIVETLPAIEQRAFIRRLEAAAGANR